MSTTGRVLFWACVGFGVGAGGVVFLVSDDPGVRTTGIFILGVMIGLGMLLRLIFSGGKVW